MDAFTAAADTLPGLLERAAARWPDVPAIVDGARAVSYAELLGAARTAAAELVRTGVAPSERVGIWLPNGLPWAVAAYGASFAGAVVVPVNTRYTVPEAADIIGRSRCRVVVAHGEFLGRDLAADAARAGAPRVVGPVRPSGRRRPPPDGEIPRRAGALTGESVSHVQYTSGTTGRPKGVLLRHGGLVSTTRSWVGITGLRSADRYPIVAPFAHVGGHKTGLLACAVAGATAVPMATFDAAALAALVGAGGAAFLQGPPAMYRALLDERPSGPVRVAVTGAADVPPRLVRDLRDGLGVRTVFTAYGITEAGGVCTMTRAGDPVDAVAGTSGTAVPGVRVRIAEGTGEILVRGPGLMAGYLDDPDATAAALRDGWLHTGDAGELDERGRLRVVGRLRDLVVVGGLNVYPAEVERVLGAHPGVRAAAVVGVPDDRMGEVPVAFVVGADVPDGELREFCGERLAGFKVPRTFRRVGELPLNAAGKVDKATLRARAR
ncbi:acyl-CoA synthetase [Actinomadura cremea]|nr:acyl-CoA synthetase [Actinomadura cremea]